MKIYSQKYATNYIAILNSTRDVYSIVFLAKTMEPVLPDTKGPISEEKILEPTSPSPYISHIYSVVLY